MNPLYATDFAVWLWTILLRGQSCRAYNVGSAHDRTILQIARTVNETLNLHAEAGTTSATDSPAIREDVLRDPREGSSPPVLCRHP